MAERQYSRREILPLFAVAGTNLLRLSAAVTLADKLFFTSNGEKIESGFYNLPEWFDLSDRTSAGIMMGKTRAIMDAIAEERVPSFVSKIKFEFEGQGNLPYKLEYVEGTLIEQLTSRHKPEMSTLTRIRECRDYFANDYPAAASLDGMDYKIQVVYKAETVVPKDDLKDFPFVELIEPEIELECQRMTTIKVDRIFRSWTIGYQEVEDRTFFIDKLDEPNFEIDNPGSASTRGPIRLFRTRILPTRKERSGQRDLAHSLQIVAGEGNTKFSTDKMEVERGYRAIVGMFHSRWERV